MDISSLPLLTIYILLIVWVLSFTYICRLRIPSMMGMMIAMTLGMTIGLGLGTVIGLIFPDHLLESTVASMLIGCIIGALAGLPISLMAVLDGLLSGLMGGMMGTMLGVMIPSTQFNTAVKVMAVLTAGILAILFLMIQGEVKFRENHWRNVFFAKPLPILLVIGLFLIAAHQFQLQISQAKVDQSHHNMNMSKREDPSKANHHRNISESGNGSLITDQLIVEAFEYQFSPGRLKIKQGETVTLILKNRGIMEHDFIILGTDIHVHVGPGSEERISFSITKPGTYGTICSLPGHQEAGMTSILEVS
jgi:plastocyanin